MSRSVWPEPLAVITFKKIGARRPEVERYRMAPEISQHSRIGKVPEDAGRPGGLALSAI